jgi:hypothetical protein
MPAASTDRGRSRHLGAIGIELNRQLLAHSCAGIWEEVNT